MNVFRNLRKTESRKNKLENQLNSVEAKVNELKEKYVSFQAFYLLFLSLIPLVLLSTFCFLFVFLYLTHMLRTVHSFLQSLLIANLNL